MNERGIDISNKKTKKVDRLLTVKKFNNHALTCNLIEGNQDCEEFLLVSVF